MTTDISCPLQRIGHNGSKSICRQRQLQIGKRRAQVAELAIKGCRKVEVAERLGVA